MWKRLLLGEAASARRSSRRLAYTCLALALVIAFFAPVARSAGTETTTERWLTAASLAVSGILLYVSRGRLLHTVLAVALLVGAGFLVRADWLSGLAFVVVVITALVRVMSQTVSRSPLDAGAEQDRHGETESPTDIIDSVATAVILALIVRGFAFWPITRV